MGPFVAPTVRPTRGEGCPAGRAAPPRTVAVVPVKDLDRTKSRLSAVLTASGRRALTLAMLRDVLRALLAAPCVDRVLVVSRDPAVWAAAGALGAGAFAETAGSLNGALEEVAASLSPGDRLLVVPADLPLLRPDDVRFLLDMDGGEGGGEGERSAIVVPSRDGGTGALLLRPPGVLPFRFGGTSFAAHVDAARRAGARVRVAHIRRFMLDVDLGSHLRALTVAETGEETRRFLIDKTC